MADKLEERLVVGDYVEKVSGYPFTGTIIMEGETLAGKRRVVVDNGDGMLHIYNEGQLRHADPAADEITRLNAENEASIADVWRQADENHRRYSDTGDRENDIRFLTLGLTGEAGEVANFVKKRWRDGDGHDEAIKLEIADVCAYAFMLANTMGMSPADLIQTIADKQQVFIAKMKARTLLASSLKGSE